MVITADTIIKAAAVFGALVALGAAVYKIIMWVQLQEKQTTDIDGIKKEQALISFAILACLDGLKQQGCNGKVTEAHNKLQKHLNKKAHD